MKIAVLGYSGSGKSTLARVLGEWYNVSVLHLDQVQFLPGWQIRDRDEAKAMVSVFLERETGWVIDGNYNSFFLQERLMQADLIVLMLLPRLMCLHRCRMRYQMNRNQTRVDMAPGCPEKLDAEFVRWILWEGRTRKKRAHFRGIARKYAQKTVILRSQKEIDRFLNHM